MNASFIAVLAVAAFASTTRIAGRILALASIAGVVAAVWAAMTGGIPGVHALTNQIVVLASGKRELIGAAVVGLAIGRPAAAILNPSTFTKES